MGRRIQVGCADRLRVEMLIARLKFMPSNSRRAKLDT